MKIFLDSNGKKFPKWKKTRLGDIANISTGFTPKTDDSTLWNGDIPWLSIRGMDQGKYISQHNKTITSKALGKKEILPEGTLLMTFKLTLGKLAILKNPMFTNEAICNFKWKNDDIDTEFMYYALSTVDVASFGSRAVMGITLNSDSLDSIVVPLPSLPEQQKIAAFFTLLDERIEKQAEKVESLKAYKKGIQQKIFSRELVFTDDDGNAYPEWEEKKLENYIDDFIVPMRDKPKEFIGDIPWCRIEDIEGRFINGSKTFQYVNRETIKAMNLKIMPKNSVIVSCSATLGVCAMVTKPLVTNQTFIGLVPNDNLNYVFLYHFMTTQKKKLKKLSTGTTIGYLSREEFEKLSIKIPSIPEQLKIAELFNTLDEKIEINENKLALLKDQKKGYLQAIFY